MNEIQDSYVYSIYYGENRASNAVGRKTVCFSCVTGLASVLDRIIKTAACLTVLNITVKWRAFFEIQIGLPPLFGNALAQKTNAILVIDVLSQVTVGSKELP